MKAPKTNTGKEPPAEKTAQKKGGGKKRLAVVIVIVAAVIVIGVGIAVWYGVSEGEGPFYYLKSWESDVSAIEEKYDPDEAKDGLIIFYGASNFARWTEMEEDLSDYNVQNHAFGGSSDSDLVEYADRLLFPYDPEIVFFQTGSNDYVGMSGTDEEKAAACIEYKKEMFAAFHEELPDAQFVVMSGLLLPGRTEYYELTVMINEALEEYCCEVDYLHYVDATELTYSDGVYDESLFVDDMIHLTHEARLIWMEEYIIPEIEALIEEYDLDCVRNE